MLGLTGFLGLTRIPLCFWAHTDLTDPTVLLCGWEISQMLLCVGGSRGFRFAFGLTRISQIPLLLCGWKISQMLLRVGWLVRIPLCFWAHTDLTDPTVLLCGWEISQMFCVCGLVWAPMGAHCSRSHGFIFRTLRTLRTNRTDWTFLKIIREICGICVRPPWDWDLCEASVDSVWGG